MKKSEELRRTINALKTDVEKLQAAEQYDDAAAKAKELEEAINQYNAAKAIEKVQGLDITNNPLEPENKNTAVTANLKNRIFNKLVLGRPLTEEETAAYNTAGTPGLVEASPEKGGYVVPEEQMNTVYEYRRQMVSLKPYCNITPVAYLSGRMPAMGTETGVLTEFDELNEIKQSDFDFEQKTYNVKTYGDIIPVSNQLLADNDVNIMSIIGRRFTRKAVNTENASILSLLKALSATTITDYKGIVKAIFKTLDPTIGLSAKIFTNQTGLDYLAELDDAQKRPLLTPDLANPQQLLLRGHQIVSLPDSLLTVEGQIPFFVGSMSDAVAFYDRKGVEVAVSTEAGFTRYATYIRAIERYDVKMLDKDAVVLLQIANA